MTIRKNPFKLHPIVEQLREARITSGISTPGLAKRVGYSRTQIVYTECGGRNPSFSFVADIAQALGYELRLVPKEPQQ